MTNDDILKAAFKVWGQELYQTMSLTLIARELGVSKPALYRHFRDKNALLDAMDTAFFDGCAAFLLDPYERAVAVAKKRESGLIMMRAIAEYYIRNREAFVFSFIRLHSGREKEKRDRMNDEFQKRGIDLKRLGFMKSGSVSYPSNGQLSITTLVFFIADFHRYDSKPGEIPSDEYIKEMLTRIENRVIKGLNLDARRVAALDYEKLEKQAAGIVYEDTEDNALLKAVAEAVADAGPWNASMEMVARRSGLSKSGLYAHFKSRQDMLAQLFMTEFTGILNATRAQIEISEVPEEQLYLAIISITNYLRSRPEILVAIDWIKNRRIYLGQKPVSGRLFRIIKSIKLEAIRQYDHQLLVRIAQWTLFMIVNTLAWWPSGPHTCSSVSGHSKDWAKDVVEIPNESFRILFRFIARGLEGLIE